MKTINTSSRLALRVMAVILTGLLTTQLMVAQDWFNNSWPYRRSVSVPTTGALVTDLQVKITLNSSFDFTKAKSDGSDIRITAADGTTLIPFWIEEWNVAGTTATIWVKVPTIPASGTTNVLLYYGNSAATSVSSGSSTFRLFDDFESWTTPSGPAPLPTAIADLTIAVFNNKLYSIGGYGNGPSDPKNKNYEYNPGTNTWTEKNPMPTARWGMAAVEFEGLIYVFGGSISGGAGDVAKNEVYNPTNDSWTTKADIPSALARQGVMAVKFGNKIHLFYESYNYEYDPATDTYSQKADVPNPRFWCTSAVVGNKVYLIGGHHAGVACNDNQEYDPATNTWSTPRTPLPVSMWGATRDNPVINGKIYVTHGHNGTTFFTSNYVYDPATNTWEQKASAVYPRDGVGCGVVNNILYVVGGRADLVGPYGLNYNEFYDPLINTWTSPTQPGSSLWTTSGTSYVFADASAMYQGNYGLVIRQLTDEATQRYAQSAEGFGNVYALDFDWQITDIGGIGTQPKPQGLITLTETDPTGSLFFYNSSNTPVVRWFNGSGFNHLCNSTWNNWHKLTVVRDGVNSRVIFDGNQYQSPSITSPPSTGTGKIKFGVYFSTTQYLDNVRVRKWVGSDPVTVVGSEQYLSPQWTGAISTDWNISSNWNGGVPQSFSLVTITSPPTLQPHVTGSAASPSICYNLTISTDASLTIDAGKALTVGGNLTNNGTFTIESSALDNSGSLIVNGTSTSNITYNRKMPADKYRYISSPVSSTTFPSGTFWRWNEPTGAWVETTACESGHGYTMLATGTSVAFTGSVVNALEDVPATAPYNSVADHYNNTRGTWGGGGWNLLGNPFTCALDGSAFISTNGASMDASYQAIYIYNGTDYYYIALGTPGYPGLGTFSGTDVQAGQGFFVLANYNGVTFDFTSGMRKHNTTAVMTKSASVEDAWPGLQLKVKYGDKENSTLIVYNENMTAGLDPGYDIGLLSSGSDVDIYTTLAGKDNDVNFTRQALPAAGADTIIVPLGIDTEQSGEVTFSAYTVPLGNNKFWLEDRTMGIFTDLNTNTYTVTLPANTYGTGRFFIIASTNTPTSIEKPQADDTGIRVWTSNEKVIIKGKVSGRAICIVYDMRGEKILETRLADEELNTVTLPSGLHGVYLVRVTDGVKVTTRKVALL